MEQSAPAQARSEGLADRDLTGADLAGRDLTGCDLRGRDLSGCRLDGARLCRANLEDAKLVGASLAGASLFGATLAGAELLGANLADADLTDVRAAKAGFGNANLRGARLLNADLSGGTLSHADLSGADARGADLRGTRLVEATLEGADLSRARLDGADLQQARVARARFRDTDLRRARLRAIRGFEAAEWIGADVLETDFCGAYLARRAILDQNYLHEFRSANRLNRSIYTVWWLTSDCGRSFLRWGLWTLLITVAFAWIHMQVGLKVAVEETPLTALYYSVVTITTLGFGDVHPATPAAQLAAMGEVMLGYMMLGGLLSIFSNKMARRAE